MGCAEVTPRDPSNLNMLMSRPFRNHEVSVGKGAADERHRFDHRVCTLLPLQPSRVNDERAPLLRDDGCGSALPQERQRGDLTRG